MGTRHVQGKAQGQKATHKHGRQGMNKCTHIVIHSNTIQIRSNKKGNVVKGIREGKGQVKGHGMYTQQHTTGMPNTQGRITVYRQKAKEHTEDTQAGRHKVGKGAWQEWHEYRHSTYT